MYLIPLFGKIQRENVVWFVLGSFTGLILFPFVYFVISSANLLLRADDKSASLSHLWRAINAEYIVSNHLNIIEEIKEHDFIITLAASAKNRPAISLRGATESGKIKSIVIIDSKDKHIDIRFSPFGDFNFQSISYPVDNNTRVIFDYQVDGTWDIDVQDENVRVNYFDTILEGERINGRSVVKKNGDSFLVTVKNNEVHLEPLEKTSTGADVLPH